MLISILTIRQCTVFAFCLEDVKQCPRKFIYGLPFSLFTMAHDCDATLCTDSVHSDLEEPSTFYGR